MAGRFDYSHDDSIDSHYLTGPVSDLAPSNYEEDAVHDDEPADDGGYTGPMAKDPWLPGPSGPAPF
ncbi:hypothetical protein SEA_PUPPER_179 [Gordonia phage Pupper]|uniref:Uncharacterized protein n=1 Tax=Gordonia phage Pupper TaxID=2571249 RepID=A0A4Y6EKU8_9CAUD|nr:hypothetical protein KHQ83_gp098 [Gordonia phage Pupper]QDF18665.1 hypothetical protein SEA_PUPPER_179 [Gordonia phage Pupper]QDF18897.1 hypothetical protein SEA_SCENTAE_178 [Gordonia phage SCentae]